MEKKPFEKNTFMQPEIESDTLASLSRKLIITTNRLTMANSELERLQQERTEMIANISHDLRAPITAIRSALDMLNAQEDPDEKEMLDALHLIDRRTATLESMINDMHYLFCVEDSARALDTQMIMAAPFLEEYFYDAIVDTRYDDHDMQLDVPLELDCFINIDVQRMIRVLDNLFTNAAKYSGSGSSITLKAGLSEDRDFVEISVIDNGVGIPEESLSKIFSRTYTVSSARTPGATSGSGLGLAIVQAVVEKLDGTIVCESELGKGSTFRISLPAVYM